MPLPDPIPASAGLRHLEGFSFEEILLWLERALRGKESLPFIVPGESPEDPILRRERELKGMARQDLRDACLVLVRRFAKSTETDNDYVNALLRLAKGLNLSSVAEPLFEIARRSETLAALPALQQKSVLFTLLDLRAPLPQSFWKELAAAHPERFGVIAFSGLLRQGADVALHLLPTLPDNEAIADSVYTVLSQHARRLNPDELQKVALAALQTAEHCAPAVRKALKEWAGEVVVPENVSGNRKPAYDRLDAALSGRAVRNHATFSPSPACAKLLECPKAA